MLPKLRASPSRAEFIGNRFAALEGGGVWAFRNCGYRGTVRHGTPSHNQIINNLFYYDKYDGGSPSVLLGSRGDWWRSFPWLGTCGDDDGFKWEASVSNDDHATNNVVMQNRIVKLPFPLMIREGDRSNSPNHPAASRLSEERSMARFLEVKQRPELGLIAMTMLQPKSEKYRTILYMAYLNSHINTASTFGWYPVSGEKARSPSQWVFRVPSEPRRACWPS